MTMLEMPQQVLIEVINGEQDICDVLVTTDRGRIFTCAFITPPYVQRQMELSLAVSRQMPDALPVPYAVLETPHVVVPNLERDTLEDTIDNLIALDMFESVFTLVNEMDDEDTVEMTRTMTTGTRATAEVAAVVLSDVLVVEGWKIEAES
jgi:hypothetical protein